MSVIGILFFAFCIATVGKCMKSGLCAWRGVGWLLIVIIPLVLYFHAAWRELILINNNIRARPWPDLLCEKWRIYLTLGTTAI